MSTTSATREELQETIFEALATFGPEPDQITLDAELEALDIDSLDIAELSQIVEDKYGVAFKGSDAGQIKTVGDAVDIAASRL